MFLILKNLLTDVVLEPLIRAQSPDYCKAQCLQRIDVLELPNIMQYVMQYIHVTCSLESDTTTTDFNLYTKVQKVFIRFLKFIYTNYVSSY